MARMRSVNSGRGFDRFINFTDAVVAIAITLMALPLLDIAGPESDETVWQVLGANSGAILVYFFAFAIVANNWYHHNKIVNGMRSYDMVVFWLNVAWIALIALIPWAANLYGGATDRFEGGEGLCGTGMFFYLLLAGITLIGVGIASYVNAHQDLLEPEQVEEWKQGHAAENAVGITLGIGFLALGALSIFFPTISSYLPILLIPLARIVGRRYRRRGVTQDS